MDFTGRVKEVEQIEKALETGENVIISGKYGIGRTSLVCYIAKRMEEQWRFIFLDFSNTPAWICKHLAAMLWPDKDYHKKVEFSKYRSARFRIAHLDLNDSRNHVLVLDNIGKLSPQKYDLIRYLEWEKRFQFVAIVESFITPNDLLRLRCRLYPSEMIMLKYLSKKEVCSFYQYISQRYKLCWTENRIKNLIEITGGYPLRMKEIALRELAGSRRAINE